MEEIDRAGGPVVGVDEVGGDGGPRADRPKRRTFTDEYKRRIVAEYEAAPVGRKGAVLRRESLFDSHLLEWRAQIRAGTLGMSPGRGRPKGPARTPEQAKIVALQRENSQLKSELEVKDRLIADREAALDVLGKGVAFLESLSSRNAR